MNRHFGTFACLMIISVFLFISTVIFHDVATKFVVPKGASNRLRWLNTVQVQAKAESPMSTTATTTTTTTSTKTHPPLPLPPLPPLPPPPVPTTNTTTTTTTHPHINVETKVLLPPPLPPVMDIGKYEQQLAEALRRITILEADTDKLEHQQLAEALRRITILEAEVVHLNQYVQATTVTPFEKQNIVIVIPYRDRAVHYKKIMEHLPSITRENWRIHTILVEQIDKSPFKRAWLMNIGIAEAKKRVGDNKTCVVTHDVDMLADSKVDYGWCDRPTQICSELSCFNGGVPYATSGGGVVQSSLKDWYTINGFTNTAIGWGGEDDDLHHRFRVNHLLTGGHLRRPNKGFGKCHCMHDADHTKRVRDNKGYKEINAKIGRMSAGSNEWKTDGLNSLKYDISEESVDKYGTIHLKVMHTNLSTYQVSVLSHGYEVLGNSTIELKLDGVILNQYQKRGFNFVTIHPITLGVIQEKSFDTYASATDKDSMIHWLKDLHSSLTLCPGCIILGGVDNEGATKFLDAAAYSQLRTSLGVTLTSLCVRCSFAFISKQGGTLFEELIGTSKLQAAYVYVVIDKMRQALPVPTKLITKKQLEYQTIKTTIESSVDAAIENDSLEDIQNVSSNQAEDRLKEAENKLKRS